MKTHQYKSRIVWTGNTGVGTTKYDAYSRDYDIKVEGKVNIKGSSDPAFRGNAGKHNPEDLLLSSVSSCHALWYLHLCSANNVVVLAYEDDAQGIMEEGKDGSGRFTKIILKPNVQIANIENKSLAENLHAEANKKCFIANSLNFTVEHQASIHVN